MCLKSWKIMSCLDNVSRDYVEWSKLLECWWAPFEIWGRGILNKKKEMPPNTTAHGLKPLPQGESWESPDPFIARTCVVSARSAGSPKYLGSFLAAKHWAVGTVNLTFPLFSQYFHLAEILFLTALPFSLALGVCGRGETVSSILGFTVCGISLKSLHHALLG